MKLTPKNKAHIDGLSIKELLNHWRFSAIGDPWFQGETGDYWSKRLAELRNANNDEYVSASKQIGWN